jgi:hypothetical protein
MIDAAVEAAVRDCVRYGHWIAMRASGKTTHPGLYLTAEEGGPTENFEPFDLRGRDMSATWQAWKVERGEDVD